MKNWTRYKLKAGDARWRVRHGGRYVAGPFSDAPPAAVSHGRRGAFLGEHPRPPRRRRRRGTRGRRNMSS